MCNIAGYVGTKPAAPILIEMMRKQEGLDGGFFTGIATIHEGKIYVAKAVGDLDTLLSTTDAASLPGTIGFIHTRTPGGRFETTAEWSHPFTTEKNGEIESALIENGCVRFFEPRLNERIAFAEQVKRDGYELKSEVYCPDTKHVLSTGMKFHYVDVLCQLITQKIDQGLDSVTAMEKTYCEMPAEMVGLLLTKTQPDAITWARINFPMHVAFAEHGAYLATAPMANPEDAGEPYALPPFASGLIYKDHFTIHPFKNPPATIAELTSCSYGKVYDAVYKALHKEGGVTLPTLGIDASFFEDADLAPTNVAVYRALYDINRKEKIKIEVKRKPGKIEGLTVPVFYLSL